MNTLETILTYPTNYADINHPDNTGHLNIYNTVSPITA